MNTAGILVMRVNHLTQVHYQTMQLFGAYRERLPSDAGARADLMNTCAAWMNAKLAGCTDEQEWQEGRRATYYRAMHLTELAGVIEESSMALAGLVLGPRE